MALVKSVNTEQIVGWLRGRMNPTAFSSVGLHVFFDNVYKRLSRWGTRDESFLEEPHALYVSQAFT